MKPLILLDTSPELAEVVSEETESGEELGLEGTEQPEELEEPQEEGGMELEVEQVGSELEEEEEEELGNEEQEEDQEPFEEPNDLGDPAVMRAVQSKPTLEVRCERGRRGPTHEGAAPHRASGWFGPCLREEDLLGLCMCL